MKKNMAIFSQFKSVHYYFVESFSDDNTLIKLKELKRKVESFNVFSVDEGLNIDRLPRTQRIANARNKALLEASKLKNSIDYVIVMDVDSVNLDIKVSGFLSCWNFDDWDAMTANQGRYYFDIYALRKRDWCNENWVDQFTRLSTFLDTKLAKKLAISNKEIRIQSDHKLIEVDSAFGGFAIYKAQSYFLGSYSGFDNQGNIVCEHVTFHSKLRYHGKSIFINPSLINRSYMRQSFFYYFEKIVGIKNKVSKFVNV
jgi:hypothetical protein